MMVENRQEATPDAPKIAGRPGKGRWLGPGFLLYCAPMLDRKAMLEAAGGYLRRHPEELVRVVKNALGLRFGVPLDALRWLSARGNQGPRDLELEAVPPGIRLAATVPLMGNQVRASGVAFIERLELSATTLRIEVRLADVALALVEEAPDSAVATLIKSGALDLSKPGNLAKYMPKRPAMLIEAHDDRIVLDFMQLPALAADGRAGKLVDLITAFVVIRGIETDWEHLDVLLRLFPEGVPSAFERLRRVL